MRRHEYEDMFPAPYRANSVREFQDLAEAPNLELGNVWLIEGRPTTLKLSSVPNVVGCECERSANRFEALFGIRFLLIWEPRKPFASAIRAA